VSDEWFEVAGSDGCVARLCVGVWYVVCVAAGSEKQIRPKQATALYKRLCRSRSLSLSRSRYKHTPDPHGKTPAEIFAGGVCIRY